MQLIKCDEKHNLMERNKIKSIVGPASSSVTASQSGSTSKRIFHYGHQGSTHVCVCRDGHVVQCIMNFYCPTNRGVHFSMDIRMNERMVQNEAKLANGRELND